MVAWQAGRPGAPAVSLGGGGCVAALVFVVIGVVVAVVGGTPYVLGVAMLVAVVALPAAASLHRRQH
jgi:hypothetical protein